MNFETWLRSLGTDPEKLDEATKKVMRKIFDDLQTAQAQAQAPKPAADNDGAQRSFARSSLILGTARAAVATANDKVKAGILEYAAELAGDAKITAEEAQRKIAEKAMELVKASTAATAVADEQRGNILLSAMPADPDAILSRQEIVSIFSEPRQDRALYKRAAKSVIKHSELGHELSLREITEALREKTGLLRIHDEAGGSPSVRTVTASSANVAIQSVLTYLLTKVYDQQPDITDQLVTIILSNAAEETLPEVETEDGVRFVKEGDLYPMLGGSMISVKTSYKKAGAAISQTRENSIFDRLGRVQVYLTSLTRQLKSKRAQFRLARICDSAALDGRYIARPGNDNGTAAFYTTVADNRGNLNLVESNALANETDIDNVKARLDAMKLMDGTYVLAALKVLLVPSALQATAWKIVNSIYAPSASGQFFLPNPYGPGGMLGAAPVVLSHPLVATYGGAATTWFAGDPAQQFYEKEIWPVEVVPKMTGGEMALRDIISLWIGSFCIDVVALSNMFFVKNTA